MIAPSEFCDLLQEQGILCEYIDQHTAASNHIITANEGNSIAMASGYHLSTNKAAMVYMQNSGMGNTVNPLTSLADPEVYSIPMLMVIGWRAEPGVKDEPQHIKQGAISTQLLDVLDIPFVVLDKSSSLGELPALLTRMYKESRPVAVLVKKSVFTKPDARHSYLDVSSNTDELMLREEALSTVLKALPKDALLISTTGKTSRELFELRKAQGDVCADFLTVGAMGHASSIAMGAALGSPDRQIVVIDGDGALLMHMGAMPIIGAHKVKNLLHILLNNGCHESVGGQATVANTLDIPRIASACSYVNASKVSTSENIQASIEQFVGVKSGPNLLEITVKPGSRDDLGRPTETPIANKAAFMSKAMR
jgi:phosphonopyruvate decarboxylase